MKPGPPLQALKAVGTGPHKRTPQSLFDAAAEEQLFEPEKIVGERTKKQTGGTMQTQYEVDARRPAQVGQGQHAGAFPLCRVQHGLRDALWRGPGGVSS